jgi:hypothetical protein
MDQIERQPGCWSKSPSGAWDNGFDAIVEALRTHAAPDCLFRHPKPPDLRGLVEIITFMEGMRSASVIKVIEAQMNHAVRDEDMSCPTLSRIVNPDGTMDAVSLCRRYEDQGRTSPASATSSTTPACRSVSRSSTLPTCLDDRQAPARTRRRVASQGDQTFGLRTDSVRICYNCLVRQAARRRSRLSITAHAQTASVSRQEGARE